MNRYGQITHKPRKLESSFLFAEYCLDKANAFAEFHDSISRVIRTTASEYNIWPRTYGQTSDTVPMSQSISHPALKLVS